MSAWSHRACEACYMEMEPERIPTLLSQTITAEEGPGVCCFCGHTTVIGLWYRRDPATVRCQGTGAEHEGD